MKLKSIAVCTLFGISSLSFAGRVVKMPSTNVLNERLKDFENDDIRKQIVDTFADKELKNLDLVVQVAALDVEEKMKKYLLFVMVIR